MEERVDYVTETEEALDMLGKGHEAPYEIHMPSRVISEGDEGQQEYQTGVWIKITASFRNKHLKKLKGSRLGVWLCIALHINERNDSHPSIETICDETGYSNREVIDCVRELEKDGYLTVIRGKQRYNIYHVNFGAAFGKGNTPTSEESSQVKKSARNSELSSGKMLKSSLKEEPIKKNQKERVTRPLNFKDMTVAEARKVPSLRMYIQATDHFPGSVVWEYVHNTITQNNLTFEKLQEAAVEWSARGFKPSNVKGVLEWAINGIPSNGYAAKPADTAPRPEYLPVQPDPNKDKYVPRPNHIPRPAIKSAPALGD
jgi:hypothetical protein